MRGRHFLYLVSFNTSLTAPRLQPNKFLGRTPTDLRLPRTLARRVVEKTFYSFKPLLAVPGSLLRHSVLLQQGFSGVEGKGKSSRTEEQFCQQAAERNSAQATDEQDAHRHDCIIRTGLVASQYHARGLGVQPGHREESVLCGHVFRGSPRGHQFDDLQPALVRLDERHLQTRVQETLSVLQSHF